LYNLLFVSIINLHIFICFIYFSAI
jgi:hypothetical protein